MTTATGDYAFDFKAQSAEDPFSDPAFTTVGSDSGRIYDNGTNKVLRCQAARVGFLALNKYTGGTYTGGDVTAKIEVIASNSGGDAAIAAVLDENGDGYILQVKGNSVQTAYFDNGALIEFVGSGTVTFTAGHVAELTVTKGSPNTLTVKYNGSTVTMSVSTHSASLSSLKACVGVDPQNSGAAEVGSFAVDGVSTGGSADLAGAATAGASATGALTIKKAKLRLDIAAAGEVVDGIVWANQAGAIAGAEIGEFTGQTIATGAGADAGFAVLKVPVTAFGGGALNVGDTVQMYVRKPDLSKDSDVFPATVIEE